MTTATLPPVTSEAAELLAALADAGVTLSRRGNRLHVEDPRHVMTAERRAALVALKTQVFALLSAPVTVPSTTVAAPVQDAPTALSRDMFPNMPPSLALPLVAPDVAPEPEQDPNAPTWPCRHCGPGTTWVWHPRREQWFCAGCVGEASASAEGYESRPWHAKVANSEYDASTAPRGETSTPLAPVPSVDAYAAVGPVPAASCPSCSHSGWVVAVSEGAATRWECGKCRAPAPTFYAWAPGSKLMPTPAEACTCGAHRWGNVTGLVGCLACRKPWPGPSRERGAVVTAVPEHVEPDTRGARAALLTWGEGHTYPRLAFACSIGAGGQRQPFKWITEGHASWEQFAANAGAGDLLAACEQTRGPNPDPQAPEHATPEEAPEVSTHTTNQDTAQDNGADVETLAYRYASEALGAEWRPGTPAFLVGRRLILKVTQHRDWYYKPAQTYKDLPEAPAHRGHGLKVGWRRLPTTEEATAPHVHVFDRSSAYLAVCSSVDLPVGAPRWVEGAAFVKEPGIGARVGLWHVSMDYNGSPWNGQALPAICEQGEDLWLWTPVLRAALDCGYRVTPGNGAILWFRDDGTRGQTKVLEAWQKHVWTARRVIETDDGTRFPNETARRRALALVKSLYQWTIGAFKWIPPARELTAEEIEAGATESETWRRWYHPEWENLVRAEATSRAFVAARKAVERGYPPTIMHVDNIGFPSAGTPEETAERAGLLTKPDACGAWRYEYTAPMSLALQPRVYKSLIHLDGKGHRWPAVRYQEEGATNGEQQ